MSCHRECKPANKYGADCCSAHRIVVADDVSCPPAEARICDAAEKALVNRMTRQSTLVVQRYRQEVYETDGCQSVEYADCKAYADDKEVQRLAILQGNSPGHKWSIWLRELILFDPNELVFDVKCQKMKHLPCERHNKRPPVSGTSIDNRNSELYVHDVK